MPSYEKDPGATLDYAVDWTGWLPDGDSVTAATWIVPDGLVKEASPPATLAGGKATVWLSGGTAGQSYAVVCRVTTAQKRVDERTIRIYVSDR